jgi:hypothetical protein
VKPAPQSKVAASDVLTFAARRVFGFAVTAVCVTL